MEQQGNNSEFTTKVGTIYYMAPEVYNNEGTSK